MESGLFELVAVAAVTMGMAQTLTKERVFAPLRDRLGGQDTWLGYLVSCPYCASHYIAFVLVPLTGAYYVQVQVQWGFATTFLNWFLSSILITVLAAFMRVVFWFVDEGQALVRKRKTSVAEELETKRLVNKRVKREVGEAETTPPAH